LYLNDQVLISCDGNDKKQVFQTYSLPLEKGFYRLRLEYLQKKEGWGFRLACKPPGGWQTLPVKLEQLYSSIDAKGK